MNLRGFIFHNIANEFIIENERESKSFRIENAFVADVKWVEGILLQNIYSEMMYRKAISQMAKAKNQINTSVANSEQN